MDETKKYKADSFNSANTTDIQTDTSTGDTEQIPLAGFSAEIKPPAVKVPAKDSSQWRQAVNRFWQYATKLGVETNDTLLLTAINFYRSSSCKHFKRIMQDTSFKDKDKAINNFCRESGIAIDDSDENISVYVKLKIANFVLEYLRSHFNHARVLTDSSINFFFHCDNAAIPFIDSTIDNLRADDIADTTDIKPVVTCTSITDTSQADIDSDSTYSNSVIDTDTSQADNVYFEPSFSSQHYVSERADSVKTKKLDDVLKLRLKRLTANQLVSIGVVQLVEGKADEIVCPFCGNGTGDSKTGLTAGFNNPDAVATYNCFKCGKSFDNLHLFAEHFALDVQKDFREILSRADELSQDISVAEPPPITTKQEKYSDDDKKNLRWFILDAAKNLEFLPVEDRRHLNIETLQKHFCGYVSKWHHPKVANAPETPRLIVPNSDWTYNAILPKRLRDKVPKEYWKMNVGNKHIFNFDAVTPNRIIAVVEGEIDAMSIEQATGGVIVIATCGTYKDAAKSAMKLIAKLNDKFADVDKLSFSFLVLFDNDDTGKEGAKTFTQTLIQNGYPAAYSFLSDAEHKVDANDILVNEGDEKLKAIIDKIIADSTPKLETVKKEISARPIQQNAADETHKKLTLTAEQRKALFSGEIADLDNARRIACMFKDKLRYLTDSDKWCTYGGQFWTIGSNSRNAPLYPYASKLADVLKANAENTFEKKVARAFRDTRKINSAVNYLKGVREILITRQDLDTHRNLLNCLNGVVDLETKKLYPRDPKLLITQMVNAEYRADFHSDIVNKFLSDIIPDEETRLALLRFLGYCLTGDVTSEKGLFIHGAGGNGKGTLSQTLLKLFNTYATAFPIEALLTKFKSKDANAATPAFSQLESKRIALAEEIPAGEKLDVAKFKLLTGGDSIPIRRLHEEATSIEPTHKMIFSGNHLPELQDTNDNGLIRRLMVIKFTQTFDTANCDTHLKAKLATADALSALLSLLIDNAAQWYKDGLLDSAAMQRDKSEYLQEENFIADFISENCSVVATGNIRFTDFIERLRAESLQARGMTDRALSSAVTRELENIKNVVKRKAHGIYKILGLVWRDTDDLKGFREDEFAGDAVPESKIPF